MHEERWEDKLTHDSMLPQWAVIEVHIKIGEGLEINAVTVFLKFCSRSPPVQRVEYSDVPYQASILNDGRTIGKSE
jgi:hypothetical protein